MKTSISRGFTLIELLIVIAIIAILSGIIITNLTGSRAKSRDGQRVSDISQIQLALEQYFDRCQQYPILPNSNTVISSVAASALSTINNGCPNGISLATFISQIPVPPTSVGYDYVTYTPSSFPTDYVLHAQLETQAPALNDSLRSGTNVSTPSWYTNNNCYSGTKNGSNLYDYCIGSR